MVKVAVIEPVGSHGGMDYYDTGLCAGLQRNGIDVTWYTSDISSPRGSYNINVVKTFSNIWGKDSSWKRGLRYVAGLFRTYIDAKKRRIDIAHFHFFHVGIMEFLSVLLARLVALKVIITVHDVEAFKAGLTSDSLRSIAYKLAAKIIVHNEISKKELLQSSTLSAEKITIIPHGSYNGLIDAPISKAEARTKLGLPEAAKTILFFGQIKEVKGLDILLEAFGKNNLQNQSLVLVIAGKVWKDDFAKYQKIIDQYQIGESCKLFIRYIPDSELTYFYSAADLVVLPYRKIYQSGVLLMSMSFGRPVLASNLPGMTAIIKHGENGYLFESENSHDLAKQLTSIFSSGHIDSVVDNATRDMNGKFNWNAIGKTTSFVYEEVLNNR